MSSQIGGRLGSLDRAIGEKDRPVLFDGCRDRGEGVLEGQTRPIRPSFMAGPIATKCLVVIRAIVGASWLMWSARWLATGPAVRRAATSRGQ